LQAEPVPQQAEHPQSVWPGPHSGAQLPFRHTWPQPQAGVQVLGWQLFW
jgi:hypothetical protein